jgi:hypothetical protein
VQARTCEQLNWPLQFQKQQNDCWSYERRAAEHTAHTVTAHVMPHTSLCAAGSPRAGPTRPKHPSPLGTHRPLPLLRTSVSTAGLTLRRLPSARASDTAAMDADITSALHCEGSGVRAACMGMRARGWGEGSWCCV